MSPSREQLVQALSAIVGSKHVLWDDYDLMLYEYDASVERGTPDVVVLPATAEEVAAIVKLCVQLRVPYIPRGAGTGLSGGAVAISGGVMIAFSRMNRILDIDPDSMRATVEPGVVNLHLSQATARFGLQFIPDPSSQKACTIGGNVGENSGGPHTLLYGVTVNHVTGLEFVTPAGDIVEVGGKALDFPGYDLVGLLIGSEGTIGIATKITVKLSPLTEDVRTLLAVYDRLDDASRSCSDIIASGIIPAALEMMDRLAIGAVEASVHAGYPTDADAVLLIEIDGLRSGLDDVADAIADTCRRNHAREVRLAQSDAERNRLWTGRKGAFGAMGRISPDFYVMDGVVPRSRIPQTLAGIYAVGRKHGLRIANVFHAGDGNLHPLVLFDREVEGQLEVVRAAGAEIMALCAEAGGSLTGEHGIGIEKRDFMGLVFGEDDLGVMTAVRDALDPLGLANPGKVFPTPGRCVHQPTGQAAARGW